MAEDARRHERGAVSAALRLIRHRSVDDWLRSDSRHVDERTQRCHVLGEGVPTDRRELHPRRPLFARSRPWNASLLAQSIMMSLRSGSGWEKTLSSGFPVGLPWVVAAGFLRVVTNERIFKEPYAVAKALGMVDGWYAVPSVIAVGPGRRPATLLRGFVQQLGRGANAVPDAHIAGSSSSTTPPCTPPIAGFAQYEGLRWVDPIAL